MYFFKPNNNKKHLRLQIPLVVKYTKTTLCVADKFCFFSRRTVFPFTDMPFPTNLNMLPRLAGMSENDKIPCVAVRTSHSTLRMKRECQKLFLILFLSLSDFHSYTHKNLVCVYIHTTNMNKDGLDGGN